jgi:signal transduction histidine kinase
VEEPAQTSVRLLALDESDRARWATELHDETLQGLVVVQLLLGAGLRRGTREAMEQATRGALGHLTAEIESLRDLIGELRPLAVDRYGLSTALHSLIERTRNPSLQIDAKIELSADAARRPDRTGAGGDNMAYRVIEEALADAAVRGEATRILVRVIERDGMLRVLIRDDGTGPGRAAESERVHALMSNHVGSAGGTLETGSSAEGGREVRASIPLSAGAGAGYGQAEADAA